MGEQGFGRTIVVLAVFGCIKVSLGQRCESAGYTIIADPQRSTNATIGTPLYEAICDDSLVEDLWYRFDSYVGNTIPERAANDSVPMYKCGTLDPVYIVGLNSHPTGENQTTIATVRAGYNEYLGIFQWNATILIHKCPAQENRQSYFLYKLKKVPSCDMAYCAGEGVPCKREYYWNGSTCVELRNDTLVITAYQQVKRFYIDGVVVENLNSDGDPNTPYYINMEPNTRLIALDVVNNGILTCGGVLASTVGQSIITDSRFICFESYNSDWMTLGYDDSHGTHALEYGNNTGGRINCSQYGPIADIVPNAKWIWQNNANDSAVVCRGYTTYCETSSPCLNNGTCLKNSPQMCSCTPQFTGKYCETRLEGLTMKPVNLYASNNSNERIVLSCASGYDQMDVYPVWSFSTYGIFFTNITTTNCSVFSSQYYTPYFSTSKQYSTRTCNLTILPNYLTSAVGVYACTDANPNINLNIARALVVSLDTFITGSLLSSAMTEIVQNDQFTFGCSVQVVPAISSSSYLPIIPSVYIYSVEDQRLIISSNTMASIIASASPESLPSYACDINYTLARNFPAGCATNMPEKTSLVTPSRQVLYWPENTRMSIEGDDNGRVVANGNLTCFVPANPSATYQWTNEETSRLWKGPTVAVSNNGTYTCIATNVIRGKTYNASKSISVTITINDRINFTDSEKEKSLNEPGKDNSALIVGVVLGIAVLLLLVVAIVQFVLLRRLKHSVTNAIDLMQNRFDLILLVPAGALKMQDKKMTDNQNINHWKVTDWKVTDKVAGVENAGLEVGGLQVLITTTSVLRQEPTQFQRNLVSFN